MIEYRISTDKNELNLGFIHAFLSKEAYWCQGIPLETVKRSVENSLCFGVYQGNEQVGFARVITDYATIAYLGDVFIVSAHRGKGLSKRMMETIMGYPALQGLRRWILLTGDAHDLYRQFGWESVKNPEKWMEVVDSEVYKR
ncbi:MAG TPA: GNAT family N-acetyltransferase [Puia sp.]|jgi:GNAT superfamily N-acetyltransferase|nr:GNAT family N-acetyltransferase [Puia sp.]